MTLDSGSEAHLIGVHDVLAGCVRMAYTVGPRRFAVVQGLRSAAQQAVLYAKGRTAPGRIVTEKSGAPGDESNHQAHGDGLGWAIDLAALDDQGNITWDVAYYTDLYNQMFHAWRSGFSNAASGFVLRSGSDWNMNGTRCEHGETDLGHFELRRSAPLAKAMAA